MMRKRLLNIKECAEYLGLSIQALYNRVAQRRINYIKEGKRILFDIEDLHKWIEEHKVKAITFD